MKSPVRLRWVLPWLAVFICLGPAVQLPAQSSSATRKNAKSVTLQEMLEKGLKARRPSEFLFIRRVVTQVETGRLPASLVRSTFDYARHKRPYPYPYFERALKTRAAKQGYNIS